MNKNDRAFAICQARWDNMEHPDYYADEREPCDCMDHSCEECRESVNTLFYVENLKNVVARKDHYVCGELRVKKGQKYRSYYEKWVYERDGEKEVQVHVGKTPLSTLIKREIVRHEKAVERYKDATEGVESILLINHKEWLEKELKKLKALEDKGQD
jgi:hypothetical protein